jgi:hypothetical protein
VYTTLANQHNTTQPTNAELSIDSTQQLFANFYGETTDLAVFGAGAAPAYAPSPAGAETPSDATESPVRLVFEVNETPDTRVHLGPANSYPVLVRGGGNRKLIDMVGRYAPLAWTPEAGCLACADQPLLCVSSAAGDADSLAHVPKVLLYVTVPEEAPFLEVLLEAFSAQAYPHARLHAHVYVAPSAASVKYRAQVDAWTAGPASSLAGVTLTDNEEVAPAQDLAAVLERVVADAFDHVFLLSATVFLENPQALAHLVSLNRQVCKFYDTHTKNSQGGYCRWWCR